MKRRLTTDQKSYTLAAQRHHCGCGCGELLAQGRIVFIDRQAYVTGHQPSPRSVDLLAAQAQREAW